MTFTAYPAAGETFTAATLQALISELRPLQVRKTADGTPKNNNTTLSADGELTLNMSANARYEMKLKAIVSSGTTPDFKCQFTFPTGATASLYYSMIETSPNAGLNGPYDQTNIFALGTTGSNQILLIEGVWEVSSTAGALTLTWAQNTANASDTFVRAGSTLWLERMT